MPMLLSDTRTQLWKALTVCIGMLLGMALLPVPHAHAQTGPGGVGNASGTSGNQPENALWLRGDAGRHFESASGITEWGKTRAEMQTTQVL